MNQLLRIVQQFRLGITLSGKRALVIANTDPRESLDAGFAFDGASGPLVAVDPEQPEPRAVLSRVEVQPRSMIVILER